MMMPTQLTGWSGNSIYQEAIIPFGRYLGDPKYGLWLEKFVAGAEFEETNTFSTTYYTDAYSKMNVWGLFRKNPEASLFSGGFMRKRQIINKDTASESQYAVKLPTDNKLKQIHLFSESDLSSGLESNGVFTTAQKIWLSIKSREEYLIDNQMALYWGPFMHQMYGRQAERIITQGETEYNPCRVDTGIYWNENVQANTIHASHGFCAIGATPWQTRVNQVYVFSTAGSAAQRTFMLRSSGKCLNGDIPLLLQDPKTSDEADWLDAAANKDVYVEVTEGASAGNWYIVLDELEKMYPS
jgi:hypothetical protein